jgi:hypothetical protein
MYGGEHVDKVSAVFSGCEREGKRGKKRERGRKRERERRGEREGGKEREEAKERVFGEREEGGTSTRRCLGTSPI